MAQPTRSISPLQDGDHYIFGKLCHELLPYLVTGRFIGRQWFVRLSSFYLYTGDLAAALAGVGIGTPVIALLSGKIDPGHSAFEVLSTTLPGAWSVVGGVALAALLVVRLIVQRENVIQRAVLAQSCSQAIKALRAKLWAILPNPQPLPEIIEIQRAINEVVRSAVESGVWPYEPLPPEDSIATDLTAATIEIRTRFMSVWAPPPPGVGDV